VTGVQTCALPISPQGQPPVGFAPPQLPPNLPPQPNIDSYGLPEKALGDGNMGQVMPAKLQQLAGHLGGNKDSDNPLAKALMNLGSKY